MKTLFRRRLRRRRRRRRRRPFHRNIGLKTIRKAAFAENAALKSDDIHSRQIGKRRKNVLFYFVAFA